MTFTGNNVENMTRQHLRYRILMKEELKRKNIQYKEYATTEELEKLLYPNEVR